MINFFKKYLWLLFFGLIPGLAVANPIGAGNGKNSWDLFVMGNGEAIFTIMGVIKMITQSSQYTTILLVMATLGFLFLAVQAGFDSGKNLLKMFMFLISTWMIVTTTRNVTVNIVINDPVTNYYNVVEGVPAIIGLPSAAISEIGHYLTETTETAFSVPSELSMAAGGGFNLFGTMMTDAQNFTISNPELKKSLSSFNGDCVIPAIARQQVSTKEIKESNNLWGDIYSKAASPALFTRYYLPKPAADGSSNTASLSCGNETVTFDNGMGATTSCSAAYACLTKDLQEHASELLAAKNSQWSSTGTQILWEQRMKVALETAGGGQNPGVAGQTPDGMILQSAMINEMNGSFRQAAVQSGNNEILTAAAVASAEAQQKSGWVTGAAVFGNMMGYVYTVLQAFTFALVPIIIIALMIPGLGKSIFINYAQLLVWMTLWEPMLCIVNFLMLIFSKQTLGNTWMAGGGGLTVQTRYIVSEQTSNLVTTAQFIGTMVPVLAWSLVKGTMAFSELISAGMGKSFAEGAGASAATGNLSMGNMNMDNMSNNKYNTSSQSVVGNQATNMFTNTGAALTTAEHGGSTGTLNGQSTSKVQTHQRSLGHTEGTNESAGQQFGVNNTADTKNGVSSGTRASNSVSSQAGTALANQNSSGTTASDSRSLNQGQSISNSNARNIAANDSTSKNLGAQVSSSTSLSQAGGVPGMPNGTTPAGAAATGAGSAGAHGAAAPGAHAAPAPGVAGAAVPGGAPAGAPAQGNAGGKNSKANAQMSVNGSMGANHSNSIGATATSNTSTDTSNGFSHGQSSGTTAGHSVSQTDSFAHNHGASLDHHGGKDHSAGVGTSVSSGNSFSSSKSRGDNYTDSVNQTITMAQGYDVRDFNSYYKDTEFDEAKGFNMMMATSAQFNEAESAFDAGVSTVQAGYQGAASGMPSGGGITAANSGFANVAPDTSMLSSTASAIETGRSNIAAKGAANASYVSATQRGTNAAALSANPMSMNHTDVATGAIVAGGNRVDAYAAGAGALAGGSILAGQLKGRLPAGRAGSRAANLAGGGPKP